MESTIQRTEIHEAGYPATVSETAAKPKKSKKARENTGKGGRKRLTEKAAIGSTPPPAGGSRPLWDLSPAELRAAIDKGPVAGRQRHDLDPAAAHQLGRLRPARQLTGRRPPSGDGSPLWLLVGWAEATKASCCSPEIEPQARAGRFDEKWPSRSTSPPSMVE